jgi:protein ImuB
MVMYSASGGRGARVTHCSRLARERGVRPDMPLAEAQALCDALSLPERPLFEPEDREADVEYLRRMACVCERFTPLFGIEDSESPECLLLDVTGCTHLFGDESGLLRAVGLEFQERGFQTRVALAPTIGAAWAAAHWLARPDLSVLRPGQVQRTLARLPVAALRLPAEMVALLDELGIRTIGQLQALPRASLPARFGPSLLQRLDQVFGDHPESLSRVTPPEPLASSWAGEYPLTDRDELAYVCRELLGPLLERLAPRREGARQLLCRGRSPTGQIQEWRVDFASPVTDGKHVLNMLQLQWERLSLMPEVAAVHLEITVTGTLHQRPRNLFGEVSDDDTGRELNGLLDRLSNRLGRQAVLQAVLRPEAQPELSAAYQPCLQAEIEAASLLRSAALPSAAQSRMAISSRQRPLRLFQPPQPIVVSTAGPEGAPRSFRWDRCEHRVIRSWGPERIESGWWHDEPARRDYFRIETQAGLHFWLFHELTGFRWFVHGAFD